MNFVLETWTAESFNLLLKCLRNSVVTCSFFDSSLGFIPTQFCKNAFIKEIIH